LGNLAFVPREGVTRCRPRAQAAGATAAAFARCEGAIAQFL